MSKESISRTLSRRQFLRLGGGVVATALGAGIVSVKARNLLRPVAVAAAEPNATAEAPPDLHMVATDGWIYMPGENLPWHPDPWAPAPYTCYVFGLHSVPVNWTSAEWQTQKGKIHYPSSLFYMNEIPRDAPQDQGFRLQLTNLGFVMRPDLIDAHTIHWHGFRNQIPFFDGSPHDSFGVPTGRSFTYFYRPYDPGTYMYHCHFEDTEHVHMGMTGVVFVRPAQDGNTALYPSGKYVYNDGDGATGFDREYVILLTEVWSQMHWNNAHIQATDWTDYRPDFFLMNGRVYPDTLADNGGGLDPVTREFIPPPGRPELQYQQYSSLIMANAGERVLLRIVNLGFLEQTLTLAGLKLRVVGKDATLLRARDGTDISYETRSVSIAAGESVDAILVAPNATAETKYLLYNRNYKHLNNGGGPGPGGQMTEVRIYPAGTLKPQTAPNTWEWA